LLLFGGNLSNVWYHEIEKINKIIIIINLILKNIFLERKPRHGKAISALFDMLKKMKAISAVTRLKGLSGLTLNLKLVYITSLVV